MRKRTICAAIAAFILTGCAGSPPTHAQVCRNLGRARQALTAKIAATEQVCATLEGESLERCETVLVYSRASAAGMDVVLAAECGAIPAP